MALPLIAAWLASPAVAFATAQPLTHARQTVGQAERGILRPPYSDSLREAFSQLTGA